MPPGRKHKLEEKDGEDAGPVTKHAKSEKKDKKTSDEPAKPEVKEGKIVEDGKIPDLSGATAFRLQKYKKSTWQEQLNAIRAGRVRLGFKTQAKHSPYAEGEVVLLVNMAHKYSVLGLAKITGPAFEPSEAEHQHNGELDSFHAPADFWLLTEPIPQREIIELYNSCNPAEKIEDLENYMAVGQKVFKQAGFRIQKDPGLALAKKIAERVRGLPAAPLPPPVEESDKKAKKESPKKAKKETDDKAKK